jgi:hypothetical protein
MVDVATVTGAFVAMLRFYMATRRTPETAISIGPTHSGSCSAQRWPSSTETSRPGIAG